jgi:SAM-dependent methyltransferase
LRAPFSRPKENDIDDWTSGYVADIGYTYGYYGELNPLNTQMAFLYAGLAPPKVATACELGFGQGVSINVHAAASRTQWWGTDFNPSQAAFAQELAEGSGAAARLFDESFAEFCARDDVPPMDYIGLHGIWSWISDDNRKVIVDFVRRKLKVGGVLYVSYNTQPGWAPMVPMRDLFVEHAAVMGSPGQGRVARVDAALAFAEKLLAVNPAFTRANPAIPDRLKKVNSFNRNYLAHEYFNRDWQPMSFARMAQWLGPAKLNHAGSANCLDPVDAMNLSRDQQELLAGIPDAGFRQTVRDFCVNQSFRKDYWAKGARALTSAEQAEGLRRQSIVLVAPKSEVTYKATGAQGEVNLNEDIYRPMVELLSDHRPRSLGELEKLLAGRKITFGQVVQAAMVLTGKGSVSAAQDAGTAAEAKPATDRLNRQLIRAVSLGKEISLLASPVTGGALTVPRLHQLFLMSLDSGKSQPREWAQDVWQILKMHGQKMMKDGKALETTEENLADLETTAREFQAVQLPICRALGVC